MEIWKDIKGYEGLYQVSNVGRVKSLDRIIQTNYSPYIVEGRILKNDIDKKGYANVRLVSSGKEKSIDRQKVFKVHRLVAQAFLGLNIDFDYSPDTKSVINHKDHNPLNNIVDNLEIVSIRENTSYQKRSDNFSSKYTGVSYHKRIKKYAANVQINKIKHFGGYFDNELDAHNKVLEIYRDNGIHNRYA